MLALVTPHLYWDKYKFNKFFKYLDYISVSLIKRLWSADHSQITPTFEWSFVCHLPRKQASGNQYIPFRYLYDMGME